MAAGNRRVGHGEAGIPADSRRRAGRGVDWIGDDEEGTTPPNQSGPEILDSDEIGVWTTARQEYWRIPGGGQVAAWSGSAMTRRGSTPSNQSGPRILVSDKIGVWATAREAFWRISGGGQVAAWIGSAMKNS